MASRYTIEDMQLLASDHEGICLSKEYWGMDTKLGWMCDKGHTWDATPNIVKQGGWCAQCLKKNNKGSKEERFEELKQIAIKNGGKCLSTAYINMTHKLDWQCAFGHKWSVVPDNIFYNNTWCPKCARKITGEKTRGNIETMHRFALLRGGKCLSKKYVTSKTKLEWECKEGHTWKATADIVNNGTWCRKCGYKQNGLNARDPIEIYQKLAEERGGKLISETYLNNQIKMIWECSKGHQWMAKGHNIKVSKLWCPACAGNLPLTIKDMKNDAAKKGGKCLSNEYINNVTKLKWECAEGHSWMARPNDVRSGRWCRICGNKRRSDFSKDTIETFHNLAKKNGGKCLSKIYINQKTKLKFQCAEGHSWISAANTAKNSGRWCHICKTEEKKILNSPKTRS